MTVSIEDIPADISAADATKRYADYTLDMISINRRLSQQPEFPRMKAGTIPKEELSQETLSLIEHGNVTLERLDYWKAVAHLLVERERNVPIPL